jgi:hypothetical protein
MRVLRSKRPREKLNGDAFSMSWLVLKGCGVRRAGSGRVCAPSMSEVSSESGRSIAHGRAAAQQLGTDLRVAQETHPKDPHHPPLPFSGDEEHRSSVLRCLVPCVAASPPHPSARSVPYASTMFEDRSGDKEDTTLDPMEPMLSMKRGVNSVPWHPSSMPAPHIYKVTMLGAQKVGKSALVHRLVAHTFDPTYRPSRQPTQLFWRHTEAASGRDIMFEIEDTPGVTPETTNSGELSKAGRDEVERLIFPLVWFEKRRKDKEGAGADPRADEANPLLPGGAPKITGSTSGRKARAENGGVAGLSKSMKSMAGDIGAMASGCA